MTYHLGIECPKMKESFISEIIMNRIVRFKARKCDTIAETFGKKQLNKEF